MSPRVYTTSPVRRALVSHLLRPALRALTALGSMHVATFWHPELGSPPLPWFCDDGTEELRRLLQAGSSAVPDTPESLTTTPTPRPFRGEL